MLEWYFSHFSEEGEVVDVIVYLLSDKASMVTGSSLAVAGGFNHVF